MAGSTITDHNNSADVMSYSGSGISIAVMDGSRTIRTITKTWAELGIDDPSTAATWSYKLPETDDDLNNTYKYVITYETTVDASGKITDFNVNNGVSDDEGHTGGGGTTVPPGDDKVTLEKKTASFSAATSEWEISFNVPKDGFSSAVVTDYFPSKWASSHWIDALTGEIVIEGLFDEESYTIDTSDESKVVITFYKSGEKTDANRGLREGDSERTVTIKLATENTSEWVQEYSGDNHTNTASLDVNGQVVTDTAVSNPKSEGVAKTGNYEGTITINGREYPVFKYTLNLYGVSDASFDNNGKLTLTDEYNGEYLKLLVKSTDEDWGELRWSWANKNNAYQGGRTTWTDNNGLLTITADKNEFVLDDNGLYSPVYQIYYYLIVKDETTLDTLERVSINAADHKVPIENTVTWGDFHDEVTIDYEYPGVDKEQLGHADSKGIVKYKIVLNPDKQTLNNGEPMEMQDSATNITVDYSTIQIETDPVADITYYYRGYTGYYTIPDRTKVTITYSARVIGDGEVPISNDAVMKGFKDSTSSTETGDSSGSGNLNIDWVVVYKHEWRKMDKGLNDAVYVLTDEDGNPILYPTTATNGLVGQPVTFTTGNIDLNELPDGTRLAEETNYRDGYAWLYLDKDQTGLAFQKGITYYFKEYEAPPGYQKDDTIFTFTISEHPDYDDWEYHKGDILRLADSEVEGNLEISKTFVGAENLTDTQKQQITFKITAVDNTGAPMKIPYTKDTDGNNVYSDETGLEITYADFENGVYKLEALPDGIYTVIETNAELGGYTHTSTTYLVDGENGNEDDYSGTITISDSTKHTVAYTNNYEPEGAHITVLKKDDSGQISLYGATFQLYKKNSGGTYEVVTDHDGLTSNGEFTIDYDNRENGVTITKLVPGDYYIKETKAPADYQLDETPFYFTVHDHNEKVTGGTHGANVTFENAPNGKDLVATVTDKISHTYTLTKVDALKLSKKLNGAKFTVAELTGFNSEGAVVTSDTNYWTFTTGEEGTIVIDADALGLSTDKVYVIWETKAPEGYEQSNKIYAFYTGEQSAVSTQLIQLRSGYPDASIVSLANGPQKTSVPNTENSMDLYAYKQWYKVDGTKDKDLVSWITEIEVQLFRVVTDSNGDVVEDSPYPDADTTYLLKKGAGGNSSFLDYKWEGLPTGDSVNTANPLTYTYYVKEVVPEGYEARYVLGTGSGNSLTDSSVHADASDVAVGADSSVKTVQIRNSPKVLNLQMEKVWLDDGSHWNNNAVTFHIRYTDNTHTRDNPGSPNNADLGGNYKVDPQLPNDSNVEGNRYAYRWPTLAPWTDNDPSNPRTYFVLEDSGHVSNMQNAGYSEPTYSSVETETGEKIIITNKKTQSDKLQVKKVWMNADGTEMTTTPDEQVTLQLVKEAGIAGTGYDVNVSVHNEWGTSGPKTFTVAENGSIEFTVGAGNYNSYDATKSNLAGGIYDNNSHVYRLENVDSDKTVLIWFDNSWANAPDSATYTQPTMTWSGVASDVSASDGILDNGNPVKSRVTLPDDGNNWTYTWNNLTTSDGSVYRYSVREVDVPAGFDVSYENNDGIQTGIMYVKNTKSEYTRATASKKWLDADGNEIAAPSGAEVVFTLYQDGRKTNQTVTLDGTVDEDGETDAWVATFEGLEMYKADGTTPHEYTVKELTGYTGYTAVSKNTVTNEWESAETSNTVASGGTIYNKKVRQIQVTKKWVDQSGTELVESPNGSVRIDLYEKADLQTIIASVTLDGRIDPHGEETAWVATFSNLDDNTIYVVKEGECSLSNFTLDVISPNESAASGDGSFTVTNKQSQQTSIDLNIVKVDATDMTTPLAKAQFTLRKLDPAGKGTYLSGDAEVTKTSGLTNTDGEASITEIEDGYYEISETKTPDGYVLIDSGKFYIHVDGGEISLLVPDSSKVVTDWEIRTITSEDKLEFNATTKTAKVGNTPGVALPSTGGPGTRLYTILGSILILGAGVLLWRRRRLI